MEYFEKRRIMIKFYYDYKGIHSINKYKDC